MRIKVISDLHLEFSDYSAKNDQDYDVLILSGDIFVAQPLHDFPADIDDKNIQSKHHIQAIRFRNFLRFCSEDFPHVVFVAGNHEFYNGKFYQTLDILREECGKFPNIHFLEDDTFELDDVIFVGGTIWTDCNNRDGLTMYDISRCMNDYRVIKNERRNYSRISPEDTLQRHKVTLEYIRKVAKGAPIDKKIVVVGHHGPSDLSVHDNYKTDFTVNGAYRSRLDDFILDNPNIVLWTHGHTHYFFDYYIGNTRVVCNPRGYQGYSYSESTGWDENICIII